MDRRIVVDDDAVIAADAKALHRLSECVGARQHVRRRVGPVAELIDIDEPRAGDMALQIFVRAAAAGCGHEPARVHDDEVRLAEMLRQPFGRNERIHGPRIGVRARCC